MRHEQFRTAALFGLLCFLSIVQGKRLALHKVFTISETCDWGGTNTVEAVSGRQPIETYFDHVANMLGSVIKRHTPLSKEGYKLHSRSEDLLEDVHYVSGTGSYEAYGARDG